VPLYSLTTSAKVVLLVVALVFIFFSLVVAMWIPRRRPGFPGDAKLSLFLVVTVALFAAQIGAVWWATGQEVEEHGEEVVPGDRPSVTEPAETEPTKTDRTETTEETPTETEPAAAGDAEAGAAVFASAGCGSCHALADAGSSGAVGPNLDEAQPSYELVVDRVTNGKGVMPAFGGQLSETEIADVAAYVSETAGA
jgi:mono/diheme cytochrome c family protein